MKCFRIVNNFNYNYDKRIIINLFNLNLNFLNRLKQKLLIGNTRSIHLSAFTGRLATRLDFHDLNFIEPLLAEKFLEEILTKPSFKFKIKINDDEPEEGLDFNENSKKLSTISKRLTSILFENEDNYSEFGIKTFGFGFPILSYKPRADSTKTVYAPIIIWKLDLIRNKNEWIISRDEDSGIQMNEVLLNYLEQDLNTTGLSRIPEDNLVDNIIDKKEVYEACNKLICEVNSGVTLYQQDNIIKPVESRDVIREKFNTIGNSFISNSGVFSLYKSQKEPIIKDVKTLIKKFDEYKFDNLIIEKYQTHPFSAVETDPTQSRVLTNLETNTKLIIHGPPGTGKSQSLTAIVVNALANKARCLIVCEKKTALEVIKKNLELIGLGDLCGIIEDVSRDRKSIVKAARERKFNVFGSNYSTLDNLLNDSKRYISEVNSGHSFFDEKIFNQNNWTDLVGKFFKLTKIANKHQELYKDLKQSVYEFSSSEISSNFNKDINEVKENYELYKNVKNKNIFESIKDTAILSNSQKVLQMNLQDAFKEFITRLDEQINQAKILLQNYQSGLEVQFNSFKKETESLIQEINRIYNSNISLSPKLFLSQATGNKLILSVLSMFSKKYKKVVEDKESIKGLNEKLVEYSGYNYFPLSISSTGNVKIISDNASSFKQSSDYWFANISVTITTLVDNLKPDYINERSGIYNSDVKKYISEISLTKEQLNSHSILNFSIIEDFINIKQIVSDLNLIRKRINNVKECFGDFLYYYEWRKDFLSQEVHLQKIINSLIQLESDNWTNDFEAWYLFNILLINEDKVKLKNDNLHNKIENNGEKIKEIQVTQIMDYWKSEQSKAINSFLAKNLFSFNALYNLAKNNQFSRQNSLRKIIHSDFDLFTYFFPVLLTNPTVCSSVLPMTEGLFDIVIFDEASQLRVEEVYAAKLRGRYKVVAGDENQMPPSNYFTSLPTQNQTDEAEDEHEETLTSIGNDISESESLLEYAKRKGYKETYLEVHYRSKHPDLIEFSNAAFYGSRLKSMPPRELYKAIKYFNVKGIYNSEESVNPAEAEKIIEIINEVVDLTKPIPSIGVATFNMLQRNYILNLINSKSDENPDFAEKINKLKEKIGEQFFVKNLENIQGDERDIIIISTTFGIRQDGSFIQNFGPINQQKGFRLLNVIVTRAKKSVYVCTSIPESNLAEYQNVLTENPYHGRGLFYAYLSYAKAIEEDDFKKKESIINLLARTNDNQNLHSNSELTESIFEQEVVDMLSKIFDPKRMVVQYRIGGFRIDIAILSKETKIPIMAIECDGAKFHSSPEAYAWDIFRQKFLEDYGLKFIRIWSVNWWNNAEAEMERLINFINLNDK